MNVFRNHLFLLFLLIGIKSFSQDSLNSEIVEQKSYQLYLDKKWPELIKFGNNAIHLGYNYFYLQMRIGIAYYENKNYSVAEDHFKKALSFNAEDEVAQEYMYFCYLFNGKYEFARYYSKTFSAGLAEKIGTDSLSKINFILLEVGTKKTDNSNYYNDSTRKNTNYFNSPLYFQLGLNHYLKNRVSVFHALTYYEQKSYTGSVSQIQYYLKATIPFKNNFLVSPAIHYINSKFSTEAGATVTDTLWPPGVPPHSVPPPGAHPFMTTTRPSSPAISTSSNYFVGSLSLQKTFRKVSVKIGTTFSNMNNVNQFMHNVSLGYSLFGNTRFILGCTGFLHTTDSYKSTNAGISPFVYLEPSKRISCKLSTLFNSKNNIIEDNGYLVNNSTDLTKQRYSALFTFLVSKRVSLYGLYQLEYKSSTAKSQLFNYQYHVFVAGISIKFK